ncbi:MAG: alanine racemase [Candidatus Contendobacter sp.]|nr:alanine racemase [Candidatus Contendobacter sp.]
MEIKNGEVLLGGLSATDIASRFGTPCYVFEAQTIRARLNSIWQTVTHRPLRINYAVKAHANVAILQLLRAMGAGIDACSPGNLVFAEAAGFTGDQITYSSCSATDEELRLAHSGGVLFIANSLSQLQRYAKLGDSRPIGLRINCGIETGFHAHVRSGGPESKFGLHPHQIPEAIDAANRLGLRFTGLHTHMGSDVMECGPYLAALKCLIGLSSAIPDLEFIDLGGGWGIPFSDGWPEFELSEFGSTASVLMSRLCADRNRPIALILEPGAFIMQDAGFLLAKVTDITPPTIVNGQSTPHFVYLDANCGHTISALLYGTVRRVRPARVRESVTYSYYICGDLMQAGDIFARNLELAELQIGDIMTIDNCGSYCAVRASVFNQRPRPAEVLVDAGNARLVRRGETPADFLNDQLCD